MYWGALKQIVYAKNWSAKNFDEKNQEMYKRNGFSNLFVNLYPKI